MTDELVIRSRYLLLKYCIEKYGGKMVADLGKYLHIPEEYKCEISSPMLNPVPIFKRMYDDVKIPTRAHDDDLGLDIYSAEDVELFPGERKLVGTGLIGSLPKSYGFIIKDKSGMALKGIETSGGVIEGSYRGEWKIILTNTNRLTLWEQVKELFGRRPEPYVIKKGDKIAQALVVQVSLAQPMYTEHLEDTVRGTGGFGSTGK